MLDLLLGSGRPPFRILCVGAHCDDIEIGCGGTLRALQSNSIALSVDWVVLSGSNTRRKETEDARRRLIRPACRGDLQFGDFPDGLFPAAYAGVKDFFESLKQGRRPDLILCHAREDRHQDHRIVHEMVWSTFRDHLVLEYEIPKWDGDLGQPNVYVPISAGHARAKVNALLAAHRSQSAKDWFARETFMALLRLRGAECRSSSGYAEAFFGRKLRIRGF